MHLTGLDLLFWAAGFVEQLVDKRLTTSAAVHQQVIEFDQTVQVQAQLGFAHAVSREPLRNEQ